MIFYQNYVIIPVSYTHLDVYKRQDEALAGFGQRIVCRIHQDNSIEVVDEGRGMPTGMHESGRPTTEVIMTVLHAGGKFTSQGGYRTSGGLHGVGASVVNALSSWLDLTVYRDGKIYHQRFEDGAKKVSKLEIVGKTDRHGTSVWFKPNPAYFTTTDFSYHTIAERLRAVSYTHLDVYKRQSSHFCEKMNLF